MKMDMKEAVVLMVIILAVVLILGYLATTAGSEWATVQTDIIPFIGLIAIMIVAIAYAIRR